MLDLGVLLQIPYVETEMGFDLSPDGSKVAFSWNPGGTWEIFEQDLGAVLARQLVGDGLGGGVLELHGGGDLRAEAPEVGVGEVPERVDDRREVREAVAIAEQEQKVRRLGVELQRGGEPLDDGPALLLRVDRVREDVAEVGRPVDHHLERLQGVAPGLDAVRLYSEAEQRPRVAARNGTHDHKGRAP